MPSRVEKSSLISNRQTTILCSTKHLYDNLTIFNWFISKKVGGKTKGNSHERKSSKVGKCKK